MTITVGIRDLARNTNILKEHDYVYIEDKKTHEHKGLFVSIKYAKEFEEFLLQKSSKEKKEKLKRLKNFAGKNEIDDKYDNISTAEIKQMIALEKTSG